LFIVVFMTYYVVLIARKYMPSLEQLHDPFYSFEAGKEFTERFLSEDINPSESPLTYEEAMYKLNPRTAKGLLRYQLEDVQTDWSPEDVSLITSTSDSLGINQEQYDFTPGAEYDSVLIAGGARNAMLDRGEFAAQALANGVISAKRVAIIADPRVLPEAERKAIEDWAPGAETGYHMAEATARKMLADHPELDRKLDILYLQSLKPDQRAAVNEAILREGVKAGGRIAVATTALYVPFKTHKSLAVARPLGVGVDVVGVASRPEVVARRTPDTYFSEITQTLTSAAQHRTATRRLK
jgi:hypothetical protein